MLPIVTNAKEVEIDGIYYDLTSKTKEAEVVKNPNNYSGDIIIPESIEYEGEKYNVVSIGKEAFRGSYYMTSVILPKSLISIGIQSFSFCSKLTSVTIPESVSKIGSGAFENCSSLDSIKINSIEKWVNISYDHSIDYGPAFDPYHLFLNGEEVIDLVIPEGITIVKNYAFDNCISLNSVDLGNSVEAIYSYSFKNCTNLKSVTMGNVIKELGSYAFYGCSGLTSVKFGNSLESIGWDTFLECTDLTSIEISNSVKSIGVKAFYGCNSLSSITIGSGVSEIGELSFGNCPELKDVYCLPTKIPYMKRSVGGPCTNAFEDSYIEYATLHVPSNLVNEYKATQPWNGFKEIVAIDGDTPETPRCSTPTISYQNGNIVFNCETEDVEYISEISDSDIKKYHDSSISLTATYNISVYTTKTGYDNSEIATATLCWIDVAPKTEGISNGIANVRANPVLIQSNGNILSISGVSTGTPICVFDLSGKQVGSTNATSGSTLIKTSLSIGQIGIVKIGEKSIKIIIK